MLLFEPRCYSARESNEQLHYEMVRWFDTSVENTQPTTSSQESAGIQLRRPFTHAEYRG